MAFPNTPSKHSGPVVLTPESLLQHRVDHLGHRVPDGIPPCVVMTYQPQLLASVRQREATTAVEVGGFAGTIHSLDRTNGTVGVVGGFGIGAPAAVAVFEELVSYGCTTFMSVGAAGGLSDDVEIGDVVVCTDAIRDEGVSHHYADAELVAAADPELVAAMRSAFDTMGVTARSGSNWTTDALFKETVGEVTSYAARGVLTVDMEASALFVVAAHRGISLGSAFCVSDVLSGGVWRAGFDGDFFVDNLTHLFNAAVAALESTLT